ncbi:cytochrome b5 [Apiospora arundinis]
MQFTAVAALVSLAATGLAAPTASADGDMAALGLRSTNMTLTGGVLIAEGSEGAEVAPGTLDIFNEDEDDGNDDEELLPSSTTSAANGDYHQADVTVKDAEGNTIRTRHKKVDASKHLVFKFNKGLPGKDGLMVQIGGVKGNIARIQYKDQDFVTGTENSQNANCKVGKSDQPWIYKSRFVLILDCGFSC